MKAEPSGNYLWFLNTLVRVRISSTEGTDALSVIEHRAPYGDSPPLHIHRTEDELFHILEGDFRFQVEDQQLVVGPGAMKLIPKGTRHTYRVESREGGRWVTVTRGGDFERFVRAASRPADRIELPPREGPLSSAAATALAELAGRYGIEFHGPPLT
jgi:quercetin dioxygenase-like cupin family protein